MYEGGGYSFQPSIESENQNSEPREMAEVGLSGQRDGFPDLGPKSYTAECFTAAPTTWQRQATETLVYTFHKVNTHQYTHMRYRRSRMQRNESTFGKNARQNPRTTLREDNDAPSFVLQRKSG